MISELSKRILTSFVLSCISLFCIFKGSYLFIIFIFFIFCISLFEWINLCKNKILLVFGLIFLIFSIVSSVIMRFESFSFFLFVILISIFSDIGGYIFGKIFKGPKLTRISPNKTYSGVFGNYCLSICVVMIYIFFIDNLFLSNLNINFQEVLLITFIISTINQFGDLLISFFKRLNNLKHTGKILPGHGGLLDRIDGMIFAIPFSYLIHLLFL